MGENVSKALFRYGNPDAKNQFLGIVGYRYLQAASNVMLTIIDGADILGKRSSARAFGFRQAKPILGREKTVVHREGIETSAAAAASPCVIHGALFATFGVRSHGQS
jgi:hypothetical protein